MVLYPNKLPESERVCFGICNYTRGNIREHTGNLCPDAVRQPSAGKHTRGEEEQHNEEELLSLGNTFRIGRTVHPGQQVLEPVINLRNKRKIGQDGGG